MAYSTTTDIQRLFRNYTFDGSSNPTDSEVANPHISQADAYIDSRLRRRYTVPITDSDDIEVLQYVSERLAAQTIYDAMFSAGTQSRNPNDATEGASGHFRAAGMARLKEIEDGEIQLVTGRAAVVDIGVFDGAKEETTNVPEPQLGRVDEW